jgi:hypothetical protein
MPSTSGVQGLIESEDEGTLSRLLVHYARHMLCTAEQKFLISLKLQQGYMLIVFI